MWNDGEQAKHPEVKVEVTDPADITMDDLLGQASTKKLHAAKPNQSVKGVAKPSYFRPTDQNGSLSAFMAGQIGQGVAPGKSIVRAPKGAYG